MRRHRSGGIAALGLILAAMPAVAQQRTQSPEVAEVRAVIAAVGEGMQAGDFSALDTLFASDRGLHIIEGSGVNHGWADYRDNHLEPELESFRNFSYRWHSIEPQVNDETAFASFRYDLAADTDGGAIAIEGRGTIVLETSAARSGDLHAGGPGGKGRGRSRPDGMELRRV